MNIDAQDAQDNQDGRLLQETLTRAMIVCGFEDVREHKPAVSGKNPVHPVHRCESKIYPCLTMNRFPATRRRRLFQISRAPAPHDGADHSRVKQGCFRQVERSGSREAPYDLVALFVRTAPRSTRCLTCRSKNYPLSTIHLATPPPPRRGGSFEGETGVVSGRRYWGKTVRSGRTLLIRGVCRASVGNRG